MGKHNSQLTNLLSRRLRALESLAHEIAAGQEACVALDIESLEAHDKEKARLCAEVRQLDLDLLSLQPDPAHQGLFQKLGQTENTAGEAEPDVLRHLQRLWQDSEAARVEVVQRNQVYAEFLRRARSTVSVMMNVMSNCLGVYPSAIFTPSANSPFERSF